MMRLISCCVLLIFGCLVTIPLGVFAHDSTVVIEKGPISKNDKEWYVGRGLVHHGSDFHSVLVKADDGVWSASIERTIDWAKRAAIRGCKSISLKPATCKIVDIDAKSDWIRSSTSSSYASARPFHERECKEAFRTSYDRITLSIGSHQHPNWDVKCWDYVSEDGKRWIGTNALSKKISLSTLGKKLTTEEKRSLAGAYIADGRRYDGQEEKVTFFISPNGDLEGKSKNAFSKLLGGGSDGYGQHSSPTHEDTWVRFLHLTESSWEAYEMKSLPARACNQDKHCFKSEKCSYNQVFADTLCMTVLLQISRDYSTFRVAVLNQGQLSYPVAGWKVPFQKTASTQESTTDASAVIQTQAELAQSVETKKLDLEFWQSVKESNDAEMLSEYLRQFPRGVYAGLARIKLKKLGVVPATVSIPNLDYGRYHALVIGNNDYEHLPDLETAVGDARRIASVLEYDYGFDVKLLKNATRSEIIKSLSGLRRKIRSEDNLLIYYAGHGNLDKKANEGYWLPIDAERGDPSNWIANDMVVSQVRAMDAKHVMVVADSCFSGTITRGLKIEQRTPDWLQKIVKKKARTALTSGGLEPVMDSGKNKNNKIKIFLSKQFVFFSKPMDF